MNSNDFAYVSELIVQVLFSIQNRDLDTFLAKNGYIMSSNNTKNEEICKFAHDVVKWDEFHKQQLIIWLKQFPNLDQKMLQQLATGLHIDLSLQLTKKQNVPCGLITTPLLQKYQIETKIDSNQGNVNDMNKSEFQKINTTSQEQTNQNVHDNILQTENEKLKQIVLNQEIFISKIYPRISKNDSQCEKNQHEQRETIQNCEILKQQQEFYVQKEKIQQLETQLNQNNHVEQVDAATQSISQIQIQNQEFAEQVPKTLTQDSEQQKMICNYYIMMQNVKLKGEILIQEIQRYVDQLQKVDQKGEAISQSIIRQNSLLMQIMLYVKSLHSFQQYDQNEAVLQIQIREQSDISCKNMDQKEIQQLISTHKTNSEIDIITMVSQNYLAQIRQQYVDISKNNQTISVLQKLNEEQKQINLTQQSSLIDKDNTIVKLENTNIIIKESLKKLRNTYLALMQTNEQIQKQLNSFYTDKNKLVYEHTTSIEYYKHNFATQQSKISDLEQMLKKEKEKQVLLQDAFNCKDDQIIKLKFELEKAKNLNSKQSSYFDYNDIQLLKEHRESNTEVGRIDFINDGNNKIIVNEIEKQNEQIQNQILKNIAVKTQQNINRNDISFQIQQAKKINVLKNNEQETINISSSQE